MMRRLAPGLWRVAAGVLLLGPLCAPALAADSAWVKTGATGRLIYVPDIEGDRIPDFSMVGYGAGKKDIPTDLPVLVHVNPDPLLADHTQQIQNAINFVASQPIQANGFRGVVELGPGKFNIDTRLNINTSGVVLRGAGAGDSLATNTHLVSQNRTDNIATSASSPVISIQGSSSGTTRGPQIQVIDKRVPVGAQSFRVASTAGMSVGGMVEIFRPSTQAWIEELGMHLIPDGKEWSAGDRDLRWHRTITRIEGNRVFLDAPITTALDQQWGGGTIRTYNAPSVIRNVGVENVRGQSLDAREESNEARTPTFVRFSRVVDGWVRDVDTRHFSYASVYTLEADGGRHITVDNVHSRLPSGVVTGGRRYTFAMDGQYSLVKNSSADSGRHDFVTGSDVVGPIVFVDSNTTTTRADSGPHHRWGNGLLFDRVTVSGNAINVQNRWTSGSGHGWAGANVVVWNSQANSFIMQAPPTAKGWLIGSTGTINAGNCHLGTGVTCAGYYDSHGTRVNPGGTESLYEAQVNDAADIREFHWSGGSGNWDDALRWSQAVTPAVYGVSSRQYLVGDYDNYTFDGVLDSPDGPYLDPAWANEISQASAAPLVGLDTTSGGQNVAFTAQHPLAGNERVVHAYLAMSLKQSGSPAGGDFLQLFDMTPEHTLTFNSLGWASQLNATNPFVGVIDMGPYLDRLQSGSVNVWLSDNAGVDWATYNVTVATPKADAVGPTVYLDGGSVLVNSAPAPVGGLQNGTPMVGSGLTIAAAGRLIVNRDFVQTAPSGLKIQIGGSGVGQYGLLSIGGQAALDGALELELVNGYMPAIGSQFQVLFAGGGLLGSGFAGDATFGDSSGQGVWGLEYQSTAVVAHLLATTFLGDLNEDNRINATDWALFKTGVGSNFAALPLLDAYRKGDLNGDGRHDLFDFLAFRAAFEERNGAGAFSRMLAGVPEPGALVLCGLAGAIMLLRGRARRCAVE